MPNFRERRKVDVQLRRISLPRTPVNKGSMPLLRDRIHRASSG